LRGSVSFERHDAFGDDGVVCERGGTDGAWRGGSEESVGTRGAEEMGAASYTASIYAAMIEWFVTAVAKHSKSSRVSLPLVKYNTKFWVPVFQHTLPDQKSQGFNCLVPL